MNTLSLRLRYRPLRIGWCVCPSDFAAVRRAMRFSFTMWGGRFCPLIPTGDAELALALCKLFRVDALYPASSDDVTAGFIKSQRHLPWPFFGDALFWGAEENPPRSRARIVDVTHPITRNYDLHFRNNPAPVSVFRIHRWEADDPLADLFLSTLGAYPDPAEIGIDYAGLQRLQIGAQDIVIPNGGELPPFEAGTASVAILNRDGLDHHYAVQNYWDGPGLYIGDIANFDDLVTYWNLRAAEIPVAFFDPRHAARLQHLKAQTIDYAKRPPRRWGEEVVTVWSRNQLSPEQIRELLSPDCAVALSIVGDHHTWNGLNIRAPIPIFGHATALGSIDTGGSSKEISFALGDLPFVRDIGLDDQHYVLSVDPGIGFLSDERTTLHTPFVPELNEYYGRNYHFEWSHARAEPDSLGIISPISTQHVHLKGLPVSDVIAEIFKTVGVEATPSKAGRICSTLIHQMGGLSGCRVFKIGGVRALIEGRSPDQSFSRSDAMLTIRGQGETRPLSEYQQIYIERRMIGSELKNDAVLGYLLDKGVFRIGLNFHCPSCELEFWRPLDEAKVQLDCEYCGHHFNGSRQPRDRDWAFRRSSLFGRDDHQEGAIPVTLALQQLVGRRALSESIYCTAMALDGRAVGKAKCETDFVIVSPHSIDQKIDLVIGECKTRKEITQEDVQNLSSIADAFPTNKYNTYIVFAKLPEFTEGELEMIRTANSPYRKRVILLTERELEPYFLYERTERDFEIQRRGAGYEDLAHNTDIVFYQKKRKAPPPTNSAVAEAVPVEQAE